MIVRSRSQPFNYRSDVGRKMRYTNTDGLEIDEAYVMVSIFVIPLRSVSGNRTGIVTRIHIQNIATPILPHQSYYTQVCPASKTDERLVQSYHTSIIRENQYFVYSTVRIHSPFYHL
jgi:hypothetical protein